MTLGYLLSFLFVLVILGVVGWAITAYIPMEATTKRVTQGVIAIAAILVVVFFLFSLFGFNPSMNTKLF